MLSLVSYKDTSNWSVRYLLSDDLLKQSRYPRRQLGDFLRRNLKDVIIDDDTRYKRITIRLYGKGVFLRDEVFGKEIGTKHQYIVSEGQFVFSKIDARNGAFGIVPQELEGAITTSDFVSFDIDNRVVIPDFLKLIVTSSEFSKICKNQSSGTTGRQRVSSDDFLLIRIPVPSIMEQARIVKEYNSFLFKSQKNIRQRDELLSNLHVHIANFLKIESCRNNAIESPIFFVPFKTLSRWDVDALTKKEQITSEYNLCPIGDFISGFNVDRDGKSLNITPLMYPDSKFNYIGMENVISNRGLIQNIQVIQGKEIKSQARRIPQGYIIYGKLRPYLNKFWYNNKKEENYICSSEFFCFSLKDTINCDFFIAMLSSQFVQHQIANQTTGSRMPRINEGIFFNIKIPIPPLHIQVALVSQINKINSDVLLLEKQAKSELFSANTMINKILIGDYQ